MYGNNLDCCVAYGAHSAGNRIPAAGASGNYLRKLAQPEFTGLIKKARRVGGRQY